MTDRATGQREPQTGTETFSRRTMIRSMTLLAGAGALGLGGCRSVDEAAMIEQLVAQIPDRESAIAIGREFLEESSTSRGRLAARLAEELDWSVGVGDDELTRRLLERIERDFRDGRTVQVRAWVLSQTEAWWAAVVALA